MKTGRSTDYQGAEAPPKRYTVKPYERTEDIADQFERMAKGLAPVCSAGDAVVWVVDSTITDEHRAWCRKTAAMIRREAETVDTAVWRVVEGWLIDDASIAAGEASMPRLDLSAFDGAIGLARRAEATAEGKLRGVLREKTGRADDDPALQVLAELEAEHVRGLRAARARRTQTEADKAAAERAASQKAEIRDLKTALRERLALGGTPALRRAIVEALGVRCVFDGHVMQVTSVVGTASVSFV